MNDEFPASNGDAVLAEADQYFLADPGAPVEPQPVATGYLTRETLEAALARLEHHELRADPVQVHSPAPEPWSCPGCGRCWEDLPVGHSWTYSDGGSCGGVTRPVSPAEFIQATRKEQR